MSCLKTVIVAGVTCLIAGCSQMLSSLIEQPRDYAFVQSVGGIDVGTPTSSSDGWILPVQSDVSGLQKISTQPTTLNSGLVCSRTRIQARGLQLLLTIYTAPASSAASSVCGPAFIPKLQAGNYDVEYEDPDGRLTHLTVVTVSSGRNQGQVLH